jgi:hypothetical protein
VPLPHTFHFIFLTRTVNRPKASLYLAAQFDFATSNLAQQQKSLVLGTILND